MQSSVHHSTSPVVHRALGVAALLVISAAPAMAQAFQSDAIEGGIVFSLGPTYNRISGLPISIGPVIRTRNEHPFRFSGIVVIRAEDQLPTELDQVGFEITADKQFGDHFLVGVAGWSRVESIEDRGLSDFEVSLATFAFHDDRRDYYDALGFGVFGQVRTESGFRGGLNFRYERHRPMNTGGVASIFFNNDAWRRQPLAARGNLASLIASVGYDTRPETRDGPFNGSWVRALLMQGLGGTLAYEPSTDQSGAPVLNFLVPESDFSAGVIDARRYFAFGDVALNLRATGGGALGSRPLPTQFQTALGGVGSLPGTPLFALDCGARQSQITPIRPTIADDFFPYYGCDRFVHVQAELVGYFGFAIGRSRTRRNAWQGPAGLNFRLEPRWVLFLNGAQGWSNLDGFFPTVQDEDFVYDAGAGIVFGNIGGYVAYPLNTPQKKVRVALRLERRF